MNLLINKTATEGAYVVHVEGELDVYTAPRLKEALAEGMSRGHKLMVVDLTRVPFLDSTALGVLVGSLRQLRAEDGDLRLVLSSPHLEKLFHITGFDGMFSIHGTLPEALADPLEGNGPMAGGPGD